MIAKFTKDIEYAEKYFPDYEKEFMLWSPIVKDSKGKIEYNQKGHLERMADEIKKTKGIEIHLMVNEEFQAAFLELKEYASRTSEELKSPVLRLLQLEGWLGKYLRRTNTKTGI